MVMPDLGKNMGKGGKDQTSTSLAQKLAKAIKFNWGEGGEDRYFLINTAANAGLAFDQEGEAHQRADDFLAAIEELTQGPTQNDRLIGINLIVAMHKARDLYNQGKLDF